MSLRAWSTPGFVIVAQRYWDMGQEMREPIKMLHLKPWSQRWRTADSFSHTSAMFTELGWTISSMRNYREFCMQVSWWVKEIVMMPILRCTPTSSLMDWLSRKKDWHFKKNAVIFFFSFADKISFISVCAHCVSFSCHSSRKRRANILQNILPILFGVCHEQSTKRRLYV